MKDEKIKDFDKNAVRWHCSETEASHTRLL